jgi:hypothetical protein
VIPLGELSDYFVQKYSKRSSKSEDMMKKTKVKNAILSLCDTILKPGDELIIEVLPKDLEYALLVFDEEPLKSTVTVYQISETLFSVKFIEMELGL